MREALATALTARTVTSTEREHVGADRPSDTASDSTTSTAAYDYFRKLTLDVTGNVMENISASENDRSAIAIEKFSTQSAPTTVDIEPLSELELASITPALPKKSFNLAPYVNDSEVLSNLVKIGVDLSKLESEDMEVADRLVKMDFEKDIKPLIVFLHRNGVKNDDIGSCITRNARLLLEPLDNMQVRVNYLEAKKFSSEEIARIISKEPSLLTTPTKQTDTQLGYQQREFMLSGKMNQLFLSSA